MPNWGIVGGSARWLGLTIPLWALPACGLVVGFGERECVDECASGTSASATGGTSTESTSGSGGDGPTTSSPAGGTTVGGATGSGAAGSVGGGASDGGAGGQSSTGDSSAGDASGGTEGGGTGGNASGGSGGTGGGGTGGNASGSGGGTTVLPAAPCSIAEWGATVQNSGVRPVRVASVRQGTRDWMLSWREAGTLRLLRHERMGTTLSSEYEIDASAGSASLPLVDAFSEQVAVAWNSTGSAAQLSLQYMPALAPDANPDTASTPDLGGTSVDATALFARDDSNFVVAGVHDSEGVVALFVDGAYSSFVSLPGENVHSVAAVWLEGAFSVVYSDDTGLNFASVSSDVSNVGATSTIADVHPDSDGPQSYLRAIPFGSYLAVTWLEGGRVYATRITGEGVADPPQVIARTTNNVYPNVALSNGTLAVSWLDANAKQIWVQRLDSDFQIVEQPLVAAPTAAIEAYGFAGDELSGTQAVYGLAFNTTTIELNTISCD